MPDNETRAGWAQSAISHHARVSNSENDDQQGQVADLLTNLMHLGSSGSFDFKKALQSARFHFETESDIEEAL